MSIKRQQSFFSVWERNMIKSIRPSKYAALRGWAVWTILGTILIFGGGLLFDMPLFITFWRTRNEVYLLKKQVGCFNQLLEKKHALKKEEQQWHDNILKVEQFIAPKKHLFDYVLGIIYSAGSDVLVEGCSLDKKKMTLTVTCPSVLRALEFFDSLHGRGALFSALALKSIQRKESADQCTVLIHGDLLS